MKSSRLRLTAMVVATLVSFTARALAADKFPKACVPFGAAALHHPIDTACSKSGQPDTDADKLQDLLKNNFCATGTATQIKISDLVALQAAVDADPSIKYGNNHKGGHGPPDDRTPLKNLPGVSFKEGDVVFMVGYIVDAHYSPKSNGTVGESCNCHRTGQASHDIHLALSDQQLQITKANKTSQLCGTVSAEVIPHYRPQTWEVANIEQASDFPVKITGQLFFDGSHKPCKGKKAGGGDPARASEWEIHPVYKFEVCTNHDLSDCDPNNASVWTRLDKWTEEDF